MDLIMENPWVCDAPAYAFRGKRPHSGVRRGQVHIADLSTTSPFLLQSQFLKADGSRESLGIYR